jgi:hypothetical protein
MTAAEKRLLHYGELLRFKFMLTSEFEKKSHAYELEHKGWLTKVPANYLEYGPYTSRKLQGAEWNASAFGLNVYGLAKLNELSNELWITDLNNALFGAIFRQDNLYKELVRRHKHIRYGKEKIFEGKKMKLNDILNELEELEDKEHIAFAEEDIESAIMADDPYNELKKVFPRELLPKVYRWLERKLKKVKVPEEAENLEGGEFGAKLDKYLEKDSNDYEENVELLVRELLASYDKWEEYKTKPRDFPDVRL